MEAHTYTVERRRRSWRGLTCGALMLGLLGLLGLTLPSSKAADAQPGGLPERVAALEEKLVAVTFDAETNDVIITGANLRIVNGLGDTRTTNGLGNLIVGYNELRGPNPVGPNARTGSHNVVVGSANNFSSFGGLVVGTFNEMSGPFASVSGGRTSTASGERASVSGGIGNRVSGGETNEASGRAAAVSGGLNRTAPGEHDWAAGSLFEDF
jgi:hypothetical protein